MSDDKHKSGSDPKDTNPEDPSRRTVLKGLATGAAATGAAGLSAGTAEAHQAEGPLGETLKNPYGGKPGGGISLPEYFRPTKYMTGSNANYFPLSEELGPDEMRISFCGSTPYPPREDQAGTCIMVELGNGKRFFFDFGSGCVRNIVGMQVPGQLINDIFLTHLHVDHYADVPYIYPFRAWSGGYTPLRIHGPSGRTPELGVKGMVKGMQQMLAWHLEAFDMFPIGDGYEIEVNEFDYAEEGGIVYDQDDVTVRSWPRSHAKDGAVGYRLDWNGLSFVWTGDGRPDELSRKYGEGADVFVTEMSGQDVGQLMQYKYGIPKELFNFTIDTHHTSHYAVGKLFADAKPRLGMVTHYTQDEDIDAEMLSGIRAHYDGLFQWGIDVAVVNVTKEAIWYRKATLPGKSGTVPPFRELAKMAAEGKIELPDEVTLPEPRLKRADQQDEKYREMEIDPKEYYPAEVFREPQTEWPEGFSIKVADIIPGHKKSE